MPLQLVYETIEMVQNCLALVPELHYYCLIYTSNRTRHYLKGHIKKIVASHPRALHFWEAHQEKIYILFLQNSLSQTAYHFFFQKKLVEVRLESISHEGYI